METYTTKSTSFRKFQKVCAILKKNDYDSSRLIPILQAVQEEYRYLPAKIMTFIATSLNVPASKVYGVATFYSHFALEPKGKYVVKVCDGTACHVKGSIKLVDAIKDVLNLKADEHTTHDMLFTIETVSCLGACGLAPVMMVNEDVHGAMNATKVKELIDSIRKSEVVNENE